MYRVQQKHDYETSDKWTTIDTKASLADACILADECAKQMRVSHSGRSGTHLMQTRIIDNEGKTYSRFCYTNPR